MSAAIARLRRHLRTVRSSGFRVLLAWPYARYGPAALSFSTAHELQVGQPAGKTWSGPQSGIMAWNDPALTRSLTWAVFPVLAATHQVNRVALLPLEELPRQWNRQMTELLGVTPPHDTAGVLQDVHWSSGDLGYLPTYADRGHGPPPVALLGVWD
jgi:Carboxypeptidase Taq (M32) metallopeptidase